MHRSNRLLRTRKKKKRKKRDVFLPGLEPGTFRVLGERDNHYTTETHMWGPSPYNALGGLLRPKSRPRGQRGLNLVFPCVSGHNWILSRQIPPSCRAGGGEGVHTAIHRHWNVLGWVFCAFACTTSYSLSFLTDYLGNSY